MAYLDDAVEHVHAAASECVLEAHWLRHLNQSIADFVFLIFPTMNSGNSQSASLSQLYEQLLSPERMLVYRWFEASYEVVLQNKLSSDSNKIFLGSSEDQVCRYCRRAEPDTTFKDVSHALPEQLGNKALIDLLECDQCNKHFSRLLDDHLAKWSHPFRIAGRIRGKNGIPKYKAGDASLTIQRGKESGLAFYIEPGQFGQSLDVEGKKLSVEVKRQPYIPLNRPGFEGGSLV